MDAIVKPAISADKPKPLRAILWGGLVCGVLDITAALVVYGYFGLQPIPLLQGIAAGLLGPRALQGGLPTALLGLLCHFFIAFCAAAVYFAASRWVYFLLRHAVLCGVWYGVTVYFFMNRIVVPLGSKEISVFFPDDGHRRSYTYFLCRAAHRYHGAAILNE